MKHRLLSVGYFRRYSDGDPPMSGTGKKIYDALKVEGFIVYDLHYNANNFGRLAQQGWGTWACSILDKQFSDKEEYLCGYDQQHGAYIQGLTAPYSIIRIGKGRIR